jgi:hypothetical protein
MHELEKDRAYLEAAIPDLKDYLLSPEVFLPLVWPGADVSSGMDRLTLGNVLLSQSRLNVISQSGEQKILFNRWQLQIETLHNQWRTIWQKKAALEFSARLKLWKNYLQEALEDRSHFRTYSFQVRWRTILELLQADQQMDEEKLLQRLDESLLAVSIPGNFVWTPEIASGFSKEKFWFLYLEFPAKGNRGG